MPRVRALVPDHRRRPAGPRRRAATGDPTPHDRRADGRRPGRDPRRLGAAPADVVGYSLGARIALRLAIDHPDVVGRLVLESPRPASPTRCARAERRAADEALADRIERDGIPRLRRRVGGASRSSRPRPPCPRPAPRGSGRSGSPTAPMGSRPACAAPARASMEPLARPARRGPRPDARHRRRPRRARPSPRRAVAAGHPGRPPRRRRRCRPHPARRTARPLPPPRPRLPAGGPPHDRHGHLDHGRDVPRHPLRALRHGHREGHDRPARGPQRLPARRPCAR